MAITVLCAAPPPEAPDTPPAGPLRRDRTSHTFVPAVIAAAARMVAQSIAMWLFFMDSAQYQNDVKASRTMYALDTGHLNVRRSRGAGYCGDRRGRAGSNAAQSFGHGFHHL